MKKIAVALMGIGLAGIAAYLNLHGDTSTPWLWCGVFLCVIEVL